MCNTWKAEGEEVVGALVTAAPPVAPEPGTEPNAVAGSDGGAEALDFKEYDLNEYDLGEVDGKLYDYGTYDEYPPSKAPAAYDDEVGLGVAAETDFSESTVSIAPPPLTRRRRAGRA